MMILAERLTVVDVTRVHIYVYPRPCILTFTNFLLRRSATFVLFLANKSNIY